MLAFEALLLALSCILLLVTYLKGGAAFISLVSIYCYLFFAMYLTRHIFLFSGLDNPMPDQYFNFNEKSARIHALINVFVWCVFFFISFFLIKKRTFLGRLFPKAPLLINEARLFASVIFLCSTNLIITLYLLVKFDFNFSIISYAVRVDKIFSGASVLLNIHVFAAYISAAAAFHYYLQGDPKRKTDFKFYFLSIIAFVSISTSYLTGDRDNLIFFFVFYFSCLCIYVSQKFKYIFIPFVLIAMWLLVLMQKTRLASWGYEKEYSSVFRQISSGLNHQFYDSYILLIHAIGNDWFSEKGHRLGEDFYLGFIGLVPRSIWSGKPQMVDPGIWFSNQFISDATYGWPVSIIGEWWLNFNLAGVIFGALFSGLLYSAISARYRDYVIKPFAWLVLFFIGTRVLPLGYSTSTPMYFVMNLLPLWLLYKFIARKS